VRWDSGRVDRASDDLFISDTGSGYVFEDQSQGVIGAEVIYRF
jgi:hypothetical protein